MSKFVVIIPNLSAHCCIFSDPNIVVISANAVQSSGARKNVCVPLSIHSITTPLAQISIAKILHFCIVTRNKLFYQNSPCKNTYLFLKIPGVWYGCFNRTSGARKPGVPARGASCCGFDKHVKQTLGFPKQQHLLSTRVSFCSVELSLKLF